MDNTVHLLRSARRRGMIMECENSGTMTPWERRTVAAIKSLERVGPTKRQTLEAIHARVTAPAWDVK